MEAVRANNETTKLEYIHQYELVDTVSNEIFDNLIHLARLICRTPIAALNLVDGTGQWLKSSIDLELKELPSDIGLCPFCTQQRDPLIVTDTLTDERFATNPAVTSYPHIRFYAGAPLITPEGEAIGVLYVADQVPRQLSAEQVEALRVLSRQVSRQLQLQGYVRTLARSCTECQRKVEALRENEHQDQSLTEDVARQIVEQTAELANSNAMLQQERSDRLSAETLLQESTTAIAQQRELLQNVLDTIPVGVWITDKQGTILQANPASQRIWGLGHRRVPQPMPNLQFSGWWTDTGKPIEPHEWALTRAIAEGEPCLNQYIDIQCFDGTRKTILNSAVPLRNNRQEIIGAIVINQNITEQQLVQNALWENQRLIEQIANATPAILYIYDLIEHRNIYANRQMTEILGYSPEAVQKMGAQVMLILLHPSDRAKVAETFKQWESVKDGEIVELEYRMQHANGEWHWLHSRETVFSRTADGLPKQVLGTAEDITERKQAEDALRESTERFQRAFESAAIGMALVSPEGEWLQVNLSLSEMLGYSEEELLATTFQAITHPEDLEPSLNYVRQILDSELRSCHMEKRFFHKQGKVVWVLLSISLVCDTSGEALYFVVQIQDITERKQAEQKICEQAALLDITTDAILVRDLNNQILFWNKGAERLYGWKAEEAIGKNAHQFLYEEISSELAAARKAVIESGSWHGELKKLTKQRKEVIVESRWTLMHDPAGKPISILTVNTDITEKKKLEAQFLRAQRMESIGTLAGGIAHDLNNVLAPILMAVQLLEKKLLDEQSQRLLTTLETNAKRGADLVKQILSFARGIEVKRTIVQLRHLISEIKQISKETFPKSIEFNTDIPRDLWTIFGDATQLHQVLLNLCVNARDAMPDGGTLSINAENILIDENYARMNLDSQVGPHVAIAVSDTGVGIDPEIIDKIFEPFFTTKEIGKGTGLGLSTVLGIVKSHGGFVQVNSELGKGTQFKVYLPAIETHETQQMKETLQTLPGGKGELILVVDDEAAIREITKESLETYAYRVLTASDGIDAIALYAQHQEEISLVLIDLMMPSMDGLTTIRMLQKMNPQIKIIAVSGLASSRQLEQVAELGINAFLPKPYTAKELLKTINLVMGNR